MTWTLRRILIVIVALSALAVAGTLYWVTATYQQFAITNQHEIISSTLAHLVRRQIEEQHQRKVVPFIDEWSRLSTLVQGMKEGNTEKARLAADRMMLTLEVAEGRVLLRNVVVYSKDMQPVASANKGTGESISALPSLMAGLRERDLGERRQIKSFLWRSDDGRPLYSTIAPIGGFQAVGFVEFVSDPIPDLAGVGDAVQGHFRLLDVNQNTVFEADDAGVGVASRPRDLDTLSVPIADDLGGTWAIATLTRDVSAFEASVSQLRNQALGIVAAVILGSVFVGWLMLRFAVFARLKDFAAAMGRLADGNTDVRLPLVGTDEFRGMRTSLESLKEAVAQREAAGRALRESEERLKAIIDNSPNAIYLKDTKGRYTLVNTATAADQGFDPDQMLGKTAYNHFPPEVADAITTQELEVLETGAGSERELEITTTDHGPRVVLMVKFPVHDASGSIRAIGTITSDITERKQFEEEVLAAREKAEEQAKLQRIILDNVGQGILVFHEDTRLLLWNELATRFTGLADAFLKTNPTLENCNTRQFTDFKFDEQIVLMVDEFERRRKVGERNFFVSYQRRSISGDGWVQVSLRSLADGMVVQTYNDITDLRRAVDGAQAAQRLAEDASRAKSDFLSNMSHELRTPLNAVIGFTEFVMENDEEPLTDEQQESLSQVLKAGRHLLVLINDVLDLSKIEAGSVSLSLEAVDVGQVVDECISLTSSFAAGRSVSIDNTLAHDQLPLIEADRIRFKQVFLNLLTNAIKYNSDPGKVFIEQGSAREGTLRISVRDTGPGIPNERLDKLFVPFERLGAENSTIEGTGIGLTITKRLAEQMHGSISVESVIGEGSTFWLEMPVCEKATQDRIEAGHLKGGLDPNLKGLILYVEDNPANIELVRKIMSLQSGIDLIEAMTGEAGIERARSERPDVILLDINLPGLNGFQVLEILSGLPETRHIRSLPSLRQQPRMTRDGGKRPGSSAT